MEALRSWFSLGWRTFLPRFAGVGALAGLAAWILVFALAPFFGMPRPGSNVLFWALVRGMGFGIVAGLLLWAFWGRHVEKRTAWS